MGVGGAWIAGSVTGVIAVATVGCRPHVGANILVRIVHSAVDYSYDDILCASDDCPCCRSLEKLVPALLRILRIVGFLPRQFCSDGNYRFSRTMLVARN